MTLQQLYEQIGGSYEQAARVMKVDKLIDRYVCRFEDSTVMERLRTAGENMDPEGIFESAHAMKGVCANLGFVHLAQAASELTEEFRPGISRCFTDGEVREKLRSLEEQYQKTLEAIRTYKEEK